MLNSGTNVATVPSSMGVDMRQYLLLAEKVQDPNRLIHPTSRFGVRWAVGRYKF